MIGPFETAVEAATWANGKVLIEIHVARLSWSRLTPFPGPTNEGDFPPFAPPQAIEFSHLLVDNFLRGSLSFVAGVQKQAGVTIAVSDPENTNDPEELDRLTDQLRRELLTLPVDQVGRARSGHTETGTKSVDIPTAGALLVTAAPPVIAAVVNLLRSWLRRHSDRSITVEVGQNKLSLTAASKDEVEALVEAWVTHVDSAGEGA